ncbi:MAG: hypothetical protein ACYCQK_01370 [Acidiferrobacteraceae bacterium]
MMPDETKDAAEPADPKDAEIAQLKKDLDAEKAKLADFQKQAQATVQALISQRDRALNEVAGIVLMPQTGG